MTMGLSTKGRTLSFVKDRLQLFTVPNFVVVPYAEWSLDPEGVLDSIQARLTGRSAIVRSSASDEDSATFSNAGKYQSVSAIPLTHRARMIEAIERVAESYLNNGLAIEQEEFVVQEMLENVLVSGVVFTRSPRDGGPYYVINYDDVSGETSSVTSGSGEFANRLLWVYRKGLKRLRSDRFRALLAAVVELEQTLDHTLLDIEFSIGQGMELYLLQVRPISTSLQLDEAVLSRVELSMSRMKRAFPRLAKRRPGILGSNNIFGQMPDWNPAEIIGRVPRRLAYSLYARLVTDRAWRDGRASMGYRTLPKQPLMVSFAGQPFIDVRLSLNSLLPDDLPSEIGEKLVDEWLTRLIGEPALHDKVEFDVAITSYRFDIESALLAQASSLSSGERDVFRGALHRLTVSLLHPDGQPSLSGALAKIAKLNSLSSSLEFQSLDHLQQMEQDCINLGTIPFAILARHAFVARALMLSLVSEGVFDNKDLLDFQRHVPTVASDFSRAYQELLSGSLSERDFMKGFGHLRPGTYDLLSPRYDQMQQFQSGKQFDDGSFTEESPFELSLEQSRKLESLLVSHGFKDFTPTDLLDYFRKATQAREYGKFVFSKTVSAMLEQIASLGQRAGLSREEVSHIAFSDFLNLDPFLTPEGGWGGKLKKIADEGSSFHRVSSAIRLPQLLVDVEGIEIIPFQISQPNFVTHQSVIAALVPVSVASPSSVLEGKVLLIENADPGFDWVFSYGISGLITKYGGANSHMAIRCAEFGVAAAIGCGDKVFEDLSASAGVHLDCGSGTISPIREAL